jgi:hypothetical protein
MPATAEAGDTPWSTHVLGTLDATGTLLVPFAWPALPVGQENMTLLLQAILKDVLGQRTVSNPVSVTILPPN